MIALTLAEVGRLAPGRLAAAPGAERVEGVAIDSRRVRRGDLFVGIGAGAAFTDEALARGAAATLVPEDAFAAMAALGRAVRERSDAQVVAVTGSTGKTSTKDILGALCAPVARTVVAEASHNNEIGLPLTLCRIEPDTEVVVLEMGMRGLGQVADLCAIARPGIGVVTRIGPVHLELLGTVERVAQAKAELIAALPADGVAVVPAGEPLLEPYLRDDVRTVRVGPGGDVAVRSFERTGAFRSHVQVELEGRTLDLDFSFGSRHNAANAASALAAYRALGLPLEEAHRGAGAVRLSRLRGEEVPLPGGGALINDCYNANPLSMEAALEHLADRAEGRRTIAVLGDMAELGPGAPRYHREAGEAAARAGVAALVAVGPLARGYLEGAEPVPVARWEPDGERAAAALAELLEPGDVVLVKASRSMGLEVVAETLAGALA